MAAPVSFRERSDSFPLHRSPRPYMGPISGSHQGPQPERLHLEAGYMAAPVSFRERSDSFPLHRGRRPYMGPLGSAWLRESIPLTGVWHTRDRQRRRQRVRLPRCCGRHTLAASSSLHDPWRDDPRGAHFLRMVIRGTIYGAILHRRRLRLSISNTLRGRLKNAPARLVESIPIDRRG